MTTWQEWAAAALGLTLSFMVWVMKQERLRTDLFRDNTNLSIKQLSERLVKVESEMVTEKEVRETLKDFILPFVRSVENIEATSSSMARDVANIRVDIAKIKTHENI